MTELSAAPSVPTVEPLLFEDDLAGIYGVPASTITAWRKNGTIPAGFFVGKHLRWHPETIRRDLAHRAGITPMPQAVGQ